MTVLALLGVVWAAEGHYVVGVEFEDPQESCWENHVNAEFVYTVETFIPNTFLYIQKEVPDPIFFKWDGPIDWGGPSQVPNFRDYPNREDVVMDKIWEPGFYNFQFETPGDVRICISRSKGFPGPEKVAGG